MKRIHQPYYNTNPLHDLHHQHGDVPSSLGAVVTLLQTEP